MAIYAQIPIRLQASLVSAPPVAPIDLNTGQAPRFWRAQDVSVAVGIFDAYGVCVDLTNLLSLTLTIQEAADSIVPLFTQQVLQADLIDVISAGGWQNGTQAQAVFTFTKAQTDLGLNGENQKEFWLSLEGITEDEQHLVYAAGPITFYNPGLRLPLPPYGYVSEHAQTMESGNATISPTSLNHCEFITVEGDARTSFIIADVSGLTDGAILEIYFSTAEDVTPGIVCTVKNGSLGGASIGTFVTGSVPNALFRYRFKEDTATLVPVLFFQQAT